jgi:hypothetical protein
MSVQSVNTSLTTQQILQLIKQQQVGNADTNDAAATTPDAAATDGQNVPTGSTDPAASGGAAPAAQEPLDPKTILAMLKIQESQSMAQVDSLLLSDSNSTDTSNLFGLGDTGSQTGTGDPLLGETSTATDPLLQALNADPSNSQNAIDPMLSLLNGMNASATAGTTMSSANQALLDLLNGNVPTATATAASGALSSTEPAES